MKNEHFKAISILDSIVIIQRNGTVAIYFCKILDVHVRVYWFLRIACQAINFGIFHIVRLRLKVRNKCSRTKCRRDQCMKLTNKTEERSGVRERMRACQNIINSCVVLCWFVCAFRKSSLIYRLLQCKKMSIHNGRLFSFRLLFLTHRRYSIKAIQHLCCAVYALCGG